MQTKFILYLDEQLLKQATFYANDHGKTLTQIITDYLSLLAANPTQEAESDAELPPITRSLVGILQQSDIDEDDYHKYLEKKSVTGHSYKTT